jgi:hypothetical protein
MQVTNGLPATSRSLRRSIAVSLLDYMDQRVATTADDTRSLGKNLVGPKLGEY